MDHLGPLEHDPGTVRDTAADLLSRPPYTAEPEGPVGRIVEAVRDALAAFLDALLEAAAAAPAAAWLVVALSVLLLGLVAWRLLRGLTPDRALGQPDEAAPHLSAADLRAAADAAEAAGDHARAVLLHYRALIATLTEAGLLEPVVGRTIRELNLEVEQNAPELAATVATAGEEVDRVLYAAEPATTADVEVVRDALDRVRRTVAPSRPVLAGRA